MALAFRKRDFGRTLVLAGGTSLVPVRILNTSDQTQTLGAHNVVAVAKAVTSVAELELPQVDSESSTSEVHRNHPEEEYKETCLLYTSPSPRDA